MLLVDGAIGAGAFLAAVVVPDGVNLAEILVTAVVGLIVMALIWSVKSIVRHNEELAVLRSEQQQQTRIMMGMLQDLKNEIGSLNKWCRMVSMGGHSGTRVGRGDDDLE